MSQRLLVIDTETGGVDADVHSLLSLAAVVWHNGASEAEIQILVAESPLCVTPEALAINRINLVEHCSRALRPLDAGAALKKFLKDNFHEQLRRSQKIVLTGHNIGFDTTFLKRFCRLAEMRFDEYFSHRVVDTASILRFLSMANILPLSGAGLDEALRYFDIPVPDGERHTALGDARATSLLITRLLDAVHTRSTVRPCAA